jgi:hypothetical protein
MPVSTVLPNISFRVFSKGALPPGFSQRAHTEIDAPFPDTSCPVPKPFSYPLVFPVKEPPLQVPLIELLLREGSV